MKYADRFCSYKEEYTPKHKYTYSGPCRATGEEYSVSIPGHELFAYRQGSYIQDAMSSLSAGDRSFLLDGLSPKGWKLWFGDAE